MDPLTGPANASLTSGGLYPQNLPPSQTPHSLARLTRYAEYRNFYEGDQWSDKPVPGERRLTFNYARVFINKAASYLLGKPVGYDATPRGARPGPRKAAAASAAEDYLARVGEFNNLAELDLATAISAACFGDGAYTVRWDAAAGLPRVTGVQPAGLDARWRNDDLQTLLWVRQTYWLCWAELSPAQQARFGPPPGDVYQPLQAHEEWTRPAWRLTVGGQPVDGGLNPYAQIPYLIFPNLRVPGEFWGEGDLVDLLRLQRELNTRISIFSRILEVAGNPVAVITGADSSETDSLKLGPNQLWTLPEGAKAEVLDLLKAGGAQAHLQYFDIIYRAMHDISEMPRTSFGDSGKGSSARSGRALEIEMQPLLHKLARKKAILGPALERRAQLILAIARSHGAKLAPVDIRATWPAVLPQDRAELVAMETTLVGAGIHPPTVAMQMLDDPDPEAMLAAVLDEGAKLKAAGFTLGGGGGFGHGASAAMAGGGTHTSGGGL